MEKPLLIIPDASVVLAYMLNEPLHKAATTLLFRRIAEDHHQIIAPPVLHDEICNRLSRIPDFSIADITACLTAYTIVQLTPPVITQTLQLTRKFSKIVWYDAIYHSVAMAYGGTLITADHNYYKITKAEGNILFIAEYK